MEIRAYSESPLHYRFDSTSSTLEEDSIAEGKDKFCGLLCAAESANK